MSGKDAQGAPANCENCGTLLQGHYCHECGQSLHSPTRHFGHALEEVFESFWHLDGRVFRTLRELMAPGRVAANYIAGQRARYIAPLRLFVILSLLTFFVGKLVVHIEGDAFQFGGTAGEAIAQAQSIEEVNRVEDRLLKELSVAEDKAAESAGVDAALIATRARIQSAAANRIVELEKQAEAAGAAKRATTAVPAATSAAATDTRAATRRSGGDKSKGEDRFKFNGRPWDEKTNPVDLSFMPGFVDRWANRKIARASENLDVFDGHPDRFVQAALGAVPTALFVLMPVFALLLKVVYLGSGRRYLEHVVVALYSHAWLLLAVLVMFLMNAIDDAFSASWVSVVTALVDIALWIWLPVYLFLMQQRVYGGHWALTLVRYFLIGTVYLVLVTFVIVFAVLAGLAS